MAHPMRVVSSALELLIYFNLVSTLRLRQVVAIFPAFSNSLSFMKTFVSRYKFHWNWFPGTRLTHWGRVTDICVGNLTIIGSDNGLSPGRRQAITWTNVGILLIRPLGTKFSEKVIEIHTFSFKKIHLKMSSGKWRPFCLGLNVLAIRQHWFRYWLGAEHATYYYLNQWWPSLLTRKCVTRKCVAWVNSIMNRKDF